MKICKKNKLIILFIIITYLFTSDLYSQNDSLSLRNYINNLVLKQKKYISKNAKEIFEIYENDIYIYKNELDSLYLTNNISSDNTRFVDLIAINAYFDVDTNGVAQKVKFDRLYKLSSEYLNKNKYNFYWDFLEMKIKQEMKNWKFKVDDYNIERIRQISKNYGSDQWIFEGALICQHNMIMFVYNQRDYKNLLYLRNENHFLNIRFSNINTKTK
jgi:hypothetical protein